MKTKTSIILLFISLAVFNVKSQNVELSKMCDTKRNQFLTNLSKELTLTFGPGYYDIINGIPEISDKKKFQVENDNRLEIQKNKNREYYEITFPYDTTKVTLDWNYASKVQIWSDTGTPMGISFGNGMGINFLFDSVDAIKRMKTTIPFQVAPNMNNQDLNPRKNEIKEFKEKMNQK